MYVLCILTMRVRIMIFHSVKKKKLPNIFIGANVSEHARNRDTAYS